MGRLPSRMTWHPKPRVERPSPRHLARDACPCGGRKHTGRLPGLNLSARVPGGLVDQQLGWANMDVHEVEAREGVRMTWCAPRARLAASDHAQCRRSSASHPPLCTAPALSQRNVWPSSRIEATRMVVPFGVLITPLRCVPGQAWEQRCACAPAGGDLTPTPQLPCVFRRFQAAGRLAAVAAVWAGAVQGLSRGAEPVLLVRLPRQGVTPSPRCCCSHAVAAGA